MFLFFHFVAGSVTDDGWTKYVTMQATVRIYLEQYVAPSTTADTAALVKPVSEALKALTRVALEFCKVKEFLKREAPTVIT